jgi:hypothetical protein
VGRPLLFQQVDDSSFKKWHRELVRISALFLPPDVLLVHNTARD